jgi:hypothetical protein
MSLRVCRRVIRVCGLIAVLGFYILASSQSPRPALPKSHRHIGVDNPAKGQPMPEFSMVETTLEAGTIKEDLRTNRNRKYDAFTVSLTRIFVAERRTGKTIEIRGLPLEWRPFSNLTWVDNRILMFDRWSQPHFGVHYAVNVEGRNLVAAVPFPDRWFYEQQRPKRKRDRSKVAR